MVSLLCGSFHTHSNEHFFKKSLITLGTGRWQNLKVHESTYTGEKPFAYFKCDNAFINTARLKVHEMAHTGEKPFTCSKCDKAFQQNCDLKKHERTHTGENTLARKPIIANNVTKNLAYFFSRKSK